MNHSVHSNAVPADARAGPQYVDARMVVRQFDQLPHVDSELVANHRQFVGNAMLTSRNVCNQLGHLRRGGVGDKDLSLADDFVEPLGEERPLLGEAAYDAVVGHHFDHDAARQDRRSGE